MQLFVEMLHQIPQLASPLPVLRQQVRQLSPPDGLQSGAGLLPLLPRRGLDLVACLVQLQFR
jgi:hypothetical protein